MDESLTQSSLTKRWMDETLIPSSLSLRAVAMVDKGMQQGMGREGKSEEWWRGAESGHGA
jgi:hypothetical protein